MFTIGATPLPVNLTEFTAQAVRNRDALLRWSTATETRSDHFEVERSFDGTTFTKVGQAADHGTTTASTYTLTDAGVAAKATGPVYYRLRQIDTDGTAMYSFLRTVSFSAEATLLVLSLSLNPALTSAHLVGANCPLPAPTRWVLLDATGRTVRSATLGGGLPQVLDLRNLASGTYHELVTALLSKSLCA